MFITRRRFNAAIAQINENFATASSDLKELDAQVKALRRDGISTSEMAGNTHAMLMDHMRHGALAQGDEAPADDAPSPYDLAGEALADQLEEIYVDGEGAKLMNKVIAHLRARNHTSLLIMLGELRDELERRGE